MKIYKFGGASVKDAQGVKQVVNVLKQTSEPSMVVVISAMGKTTNAFEKIVQSYLSKNPDLPSQITTVFDQHLSFAESLFDQSTHQVFKDIKALREELRDFMAHNKATNHPFVYDQIVGYGEMLSTTIVAHYCRDNGLPVQWLDVRTCIKTDSTFREGQVDWSATQAAIKNKINPKAITLTQGFLGRETKHNFTTTPWTRGKRL